MPLVSIIIPTLGRPQLLIRAIKSVLAQTMTDFEIIVVVDGQDEETITALRQISDRRLRMIQNVTSMGSGPARNVGAATALGLWIAFLDDDDEWVPQKLERQLTVAKSFNEDILVCCLTTFVTPIAQYVWPRRIYDNTVPVDEYLFDRRSFFKGDTFLQSSSFFLRRDLFDSLKFGEHHDDWDFILRAVNAKHIRIVTVAEPLVIVYAEEQRASLSSGFSWKKSLEWIENTRSLVSPRAFSGFCLTMVGPEVAEAGEYSAFFMLLARAFRYGSPRLIHLALYFGFWLIPMGWRRHLRKALSGKPRIDSV